MTFLQPWVCLCREKLVFESRQNYFKIDKLLTLK